MKRKINILNEIDNLINEAFYKLLAPDYKTMAGKRVPPTEIYINPTWSEIRSILKDNPKMQVIRFTIDVDTGDEYVWNGSKLIHRFVIDDVKPKRYISGTYSFKEKNGAFDMHSCNPKNKNFVFNYFVNSGLFKKLRIREPVRIIPSFLKDVIWYESGE